MSATAQQAASSIAPVSIPTSTANANKPGPHAQIAVDSLSQKPNNHSPPRPKSPMPPTATLTDAGMTLLNNDDGTSSSPKQTLPNEGNATNTKHADTASAAAAEPSSSSNLSRIISPDGTSAVKAQNHQASATLPIPSPPAEVEATLTKLTSHANVVGVLVLSRPEVLVIRSGGEYFDPTGQGARDRAIRLKHIVEMVRNVVQNLEENVAKTELGDEIGFLRIRTKRYELMISPSEKYLLVVTQDPTKSS